MLEASRSVAIQTWAILGNLNKIVELQKVFNYEVIDPS